MPAVGQVFEYISTARVAKSAAEAQEMLILRPGDGITMNRYRLLADAKAKALKLAEDYTPPEPPTFVLPGPSGKVALDMAVDGFVNIGKATKHDMVVVGRSRGNPLRRRGRPDRDGHRGPTCSNWSAAAS